MTSHEYQKIDSTHVLVEEKYSLPGNVIFTKTNYDSPESTF